MELFFFTCELNINKQNHSQAMGKKYVWTSKEKVRETPVLLTSYFPVFISRTPEVYSKFSND